MKRFLGILASAIMIAGLLVIPAQAYTTFDDFVASGANHRLSHSAFDPGTGNRTMFIESRLIDCSDVGFPESGVTNNDVIQLLDIPANTYIMGFGIRNLRALHSGTSIEVGDGADPDGYVGNDNKGSAPYIRLDVTTSGASVWGVNIPGPYLSGATNGLTSIYDNTGPYFRSGMSPYIGPDTIDAKVYVNYNTLSSSGVTPYFEVFVWGFHVPTN